LKHWMATGSGFAPVAQVLWFGSTFTTLTAMKSAS